MILDAERSTVALPAGSVLDLGATAKAWAADRVACLVASRLACGVLVSLGGDIAIGGQAPEEGFAIGIADICGDPAPPTTVSIVSGGLATSGIGNRHWTLRRPPRPPPADSGDRSSRGHALENGVGGGRILRRRQHGVHGGHGHG